MVRHYTLSSEDLALINRRRGDPNRLGFALMLCYLHFPGRILQLQQGEQPPAALCAFVAELRVGEEFIAEFEGARKDCDITRWGQFTDIKDVKEEMLRRLDVHFEKWLNP